MVDFLFLAITYKLLVITEEIIRKKLKIIKLIWSKLYYEVGMNIWR